MAGRPGSPDRRRLLVGALAFAAAAVPLRAAAQVAGPPGAAPGGTASPAAPPRRPEVIVVARERILREAIAARRLREAEIELTDRLQALIDATKEAFAAEEEELARLRGELPEDEFEARVADFDQRVRRARRGAQERAASLQKGFQDARAEIAAALTPLMERLRLETGASLVLNAEQVLALDPAIDMTDRAIALLDAEGPRPEPPAIDLSAPLFDLGDVPETLPLPERESGTVPP